MSKPQTMVEALEAQLSDSKGIILIKGENDDKFISYRQFYQKSLEILGALQAKGFQPNDEVIIQVDDEEKYLQALWASLLGGMITLPITVGNTVEHKSRIYRVWRLLNHPRMIATSDVLNSLEKLPGEEADTNLMAVIKENSVVVDDLNKFTIPGTIYRQKIDDPALIMFSSGSTGDPKGVITTHRNMLAVTEGLIERFQVGPDDVSLHWMPLTHMVGVAFCNFLPIMSGTNQCLMSKNLFFQNPVLWLKKVNQYRATLLLTANFAIKHLFSRLNPSDGADWDFSGVRLITIGGEPIALPLVNTLLKNLAVYGLPQNVMCPVYGITEGMVAACGAPGDGIQSLTLDRKHLAVGAMIKETNQPEEGITFSILGAPPYPCKVRICDDQDQDLGSNRVGHIQVNGPIVTPGYYKNEAATAKIFTADGWLRTGDLGFIRDGKVTITGREKEVIIVNTLNFYLFDIERVAESVEGVRPGTIAACGILNKQTMSEEAILFVAFEHNLSEFAPLAVRIKNHLKVRLGLPVKSLIPVKEIPRTALGKLNKSILKNMYESGSYTVIEHELEKLMGEQIEQRNIATPQNEIETKLVALWSRILGVPSVGVNENFFELGGQSIKVPEMVELINEEFKVNVPIRTVFENPTIQVIAAEIKKLLP